MDNKDNSGANNSTDNDDDNSMMTNASVPDIRVAQQES